MLDNIRFIHCALPDVNFKDIAINQSIKIKQYQNLKKGFTIECLPFVLQINSDNKREISEIHKKTGLCLFITKKDKKIFVMYKSKIISNIKINLKDIFYINNGLDAAKCIRLAKIPLIREAGKLDLLKKQLKVVMFLTNSKNIKQLLTAPIVNIL